MNRPNFGNEPSEITEVMIAYDNEYLWVGARLYMRDAKTGFILIDLQEASGKLRFTIKNSLFLARTILNGSGKGIANVKQRLEIIYPGKYKLMVDEKENVYSVELEIDLT